MIPLSLAIVGADYPNKDGGNRRSEIAFCNPGEPIELRPEPRNKHDEHAIAVFTTHGHQIGYITAERAPMILKRLHDGLDVRCVFQSAASFGAWARCTFDGSEPVLPAITPPSPSLGSEPEDFEPDFDPGFD